MEYKKIKKDNYTLHLIKTDRFKTINVGLKFTKLYDKNEFCYLKLLERVLPMNGTKKYKNVNEITKKLESLYNAGITFRSLITSKNMSFEASLRFINPKYTEMSIYNETFDMFREIIVNPIIKDNCFNVFDVHKENLINSINNVKDNMGAYGSLLFNERFYKDTIYAENNYKDIDIFKSLTNKQLYKTYLKLFDSFKIDVFVIGDYDEESILTNVDKLLKGFKEKDNTSKELYIDIKSKYKIDKEEYPANQSILLVGLTLKDLTIEERDYQMLLYSTILGSMNNSVLFVNVREKNSLCYHIGSTINRFTKTIIIDSGINKENFDETLRLIKESLESMKDESVVDSLINNAKKTLNIAFNDFYENPFKIVNYYYLREFTNIPSIEDRKKYIDNMTSKNVSDLAKKIDIKEVFLLEGVKNEEN